MFTLRDYEKRDFDALFQLDRLCFDPSIAYSRPELSSFIEQHRAFTIVAEWDERAASASSDGAAAGEVRTEPRPGAAPRPLAGFVTCHFQRQGYGHIITIDVHPDARRNH